MFRGLPLRECGDARAIQRVRLLSLRDLYTFFASLRPPYLPRLLFLPSILYAHPIHQSPALPNTMDSGPSARNESRAPIVRRLMGLKASRFEDCFYVKERADRGRRSSFLYFLWHPRRIHTPASALTQTQKRNRIQLCVPRVKKPRVNNARPGHQWSEMSSN